MTVICLVIVEFDFRKSLWAESEEWDWLTANDHAGNQDDPVDNLCNDKIDDHSYILYDRRRGCQHERRYVCWHRLLWSFEWPLAWPSWIMISVRYSNWYSLYHLYIISNRHSTRYKYRNIRVSTEIEMQYWNVSLVIKSDGKCELQSAKKNTEHVREGIMNGKEFLWKVGV